MPTGRVGLTRTRAPTQAGGQGACPLVPLPDATWPGWLGLAEPRLRVTLSNLAPLGGGVPHKGGLPPLCRYLMIGSITATLPSARRYTIWTSPEFSSRYT